MKEELSDFQFFLIGLSCLGILLVVLLALPVALMIAGVVVLLKTWF